MLSYRIGAKKDSSKISRSTSSSCSFSVVADDVHQVNRKTRVKHLSEQKVSNSLSFSVFSSEWRQKVKVLWRSVAVPQVSVRLRLLSFQSLEIFFKHVFYSLFFHFSELKNKNSPRSNLKFRFDKLSHSAAVSPSMWESRSLSNAWQDTGWLWLSLKISCGGV